MSISFLSQDTPKKPNLEEIAIISPERDVTRTWIGEILDAQDPILKLRGHTRLDIYEKVLEDWQVQTCFQQRRRAVTRYRWEVSPGARPNQDPGRAEKKAADFIRAQLDAIAWDDITDKKLYGVYFGYSVGELMFARDGMNTVLDDTRGGIRVRDRRRFVFGSDFGLRLLTREKLLYGEQVPAGKFWVFSTGASHSDDPFGRGLASWLYWPVLFKRDGFKLWLAFLDKFGGGSLLGKYPPGSTTEQIKTLNRALQAIRSGGGASIPEGMMVEILEIARSGVEDYGALQDRMDAAIAKVILGQVGTSEGVAGQHRGEMQHDVRQDLVISDADLVCSSFNRGPVRWLTQWNFPDAVPPLVYRKIEDAPDLNSLADRDNKIISLGFAPKPEYIHDQYGDGFVGAGPDGEMAGLPPTLMTPLLEVIKNVADGKITATAGRQILINCFPGGFTEEIASKLIEEPPRNQGPDVGGQIAQILGQQGGNAQADGQTPPQGQTPPDEAAFSLLLSEIEGLIPQSIEFARKCTTGYPCKGTCISTKKNCKSPLAGQATTYAGWLQLQGQTQPPTATTGGTVKGKKSSSKKTTQAAATPAAPATTPAATPAAPAAATSPQPSATPAATPAAPTPATAPQPSAQQAILQFRKQPVAQLRQMAATAGIDVNQVGNNKQALAGALGLHSAGQLQSNYYLQPGSVATAPAATPKTRTKKQSPAASSSTATPGSTLRVNQAELDRRRNELIQKHGQAAVDAAEKNLQGLLSKAGVYMNVGGNSTLEEIIDNGTKNAFELNRTSHSIPFLRDSNYLNARARVEDLVMGVDKNTPAADRPNYGYLGDPKAPKGAYHNRMAQEYGGISIKWKDGVKDDSTFTGADSFKSGIASPVRDPKAASVVPYTRHGYNIENLPSNYPGYYAFADSNSGSNLSGSARAKNVGSLATTLAPTGNAYMEVQFHRKLQSADIDELHYNSKYAGQPSLKVLNWAHTNNVPVFVDGKQVAGPGVAAPPAAPATPTQKIRANHPLMKMGIADPNNVNYQHYDRPDYKPMMSQTEADQYVSNSVFKKKTFYHGTNPKGAQSITTSGVDIQRNRVAVYGQGFYMGDRITTAQAYSAGKIVVGKADVRKPLQVKGYGGTDRAIKAAPEWKTLDPAIKKQYSLNTKEGLRALAMHMGYDGIHVTTNDYYVAFNTQQFVSYEVQ